MHESCEVHQAIEMDIRPSGPLRIQLPDSAFDKVSVVDVNDKRERLVKFANPPPNKLHAHRTSLIKPFILISGTKFHLNIFTKER